MGVDVEPVTDFDDPRLDDYRHLREPNRRQWLERERGVLVAEGTHAIAALLRSPFPVRSLLVATERLAVAERLLGEAERLLSDATRVPLLIAPLDLLRTFVGFDVHRGLLAAAGRMPPRDPAGLIEGAASLALLAAVNDHENIGALFRNAAAFGLGGVLLDQRCSDPLYRRAIRVSSGHSLLVPFAAWHQGLDPLGPLRAAGFTSIALTPRPDASPIDALEPPARPAILLGPEGPGLSDEMLAAADITVRIPMAAGVDSLNVATAAAVAFHRLVRRPGPPDPPDLTTPCGSRGS